MDRGLRLLGKGTFGCVVSPPLPCVDGSASDVSQPRDATGRFVPVTPGHPSVSKIFTDDAKGSDSETEERRTKYANEVAPASTVPMLGRCRVSARSLPGPLLQACFPQRPDETTDERDVRVSRQLTAQPELHQLVSAYGGVDLATFSTLADVTVLDVLTLFTPLVHGLAVLHGADTGHYDVKVKNIVVDGHKQARFIDFGLAYEDTLDGETYLYWPAEVSLQAAISKRTEQGLTSAILQFMMDSVHDYEAQDVVVELLRKGLHFDDEELDNVLNRRRLLASYLAANYHPTDQRLIEVVGTEKDAAERVLLGIQHYVDHAACITAEGIDVYMLVVALAEAVLSWMRHHPQTERDSALWTHLVEFIFRDFVATRNKGTIEELKEEIARVLYFARVIYSGS